MPSPWPRRGGSTIVRSFAPVSFKLPVGRARRNRGQELIPGSGSAQYSYAGLWHNGSPAASLVARRTRQLPVDFGRGSTFVETLDNEDIEDAAVRFLRSI